jgi:hypothetical protein
MNPDFRGNPSTIECTIGQDNKTVRVRCGQVVEMVGEIVGNRVTFSTPPLTKDHLVASYTAHVDDRGTSLDGEWTLTGGVLNERGRFRAAKLQ